MPAWLPLGAIFIVIVSGVGGLCALLLRRRRWSGVAGNVRAELYTALYELLAVVDRMAARPLDGGGVLPADYGIAKANARAALAKARGEIN